LGGDRLIELSRSNEDIEDVGAYETFEQHDVQIGSWRVHYVDTGTGPPVVMVHGSPVSSFAFRQQTFQQQADMLCMLLDHLSLGPYRLIGHDWGGPIGLGCAAKRPERVDQLVLINTTILADFKPPRYWKPFTVRGVGELLLVRINVFSRGLPFLMRSARSPEVRQIYSQPLKTRGLRRTVLALERLEGYDDLMKQVEAALPRLSQIPTLIIWGQPDVYFRPHELQRLKDVFPAAVVREIPDGGHFPQEDAPEAVTAALLDFLE
jgi:haloalkane dehalogenase